VPEWEALEQQVFPRSPFASPSWVRLWWEHCRRNTASTRDELFLHALRDQSGQLIAVAPLMVTRRPAFPPFQIRILQFVGADPSITEIRGVICKPENQDMVVRSLTEYFSRHQSDFDIFLWNGVRNVELVADALRPPNSMEDDMLPDYLLELPQSWEELLSGLSSNMRKSIRKSYEFLERDGHKFVFRSITRPDNLGAALESFFSLHEARSSAPGMKTHLDRLSGQPRHRSLIVDFVREMAERNQLHILQLEIDSVIVATRIAFLLGDDLYFYFSGYDPNWRKYSVMTTLVCEAIKWAIANGLKRVNLSTGSDPGKLRWKPAEIRYYNGCVVSPTLRGRLASFTHNAVMRVRQTDDENTDQER